MLSVLTCIAFDHDLRLVVVAAVICATACAAAFGAHIRALKSRGIMRFAWAGLTGVVAGSGVWATHFIAMLAYLPDLPVGYEIAGTALSLAIAIAGMGAGFLVPVLAQGRAAVLAGGALTGLAVGAMHFTGIAAFRTQARIDWDMPYVIAALIIGAVGAAGAFFLRSRLEGRAGWIAPAVGLVVAIVGLHFTAMTAVRLVPDPTLAVPAELVGRATLAVATAVLAGLIFTVAISLTWMERMGQHSTLSGLRHALNAVPGGLAFFDANERVIAWNGAFADLMALTGVEMSRNTPRAQLFSAVEAAGWFDRAEPAPLLPAGQHWAVKPPRQFQLPDGRWMRSETFQTSDGGGAVVLSDITEQLETARTLSAARDAAEAANAAKTAFLANMSHEIRTPLNGMLGVAEVLSRTKLTDKQRELVTVMQDSGGHLNGLLADLLDLARVEAGALELRPEPAEVSQLVETVRGLFAPRADEKKLGLRVELGPQAGDWVECDPLRLRQVIANLVSNAIKFTEAGQITIAVERHGERLTFEVRDTGPGFDEAAKATIFGRFQQADETLTRRHGGAGLGLALSQEYVRLMGGELTCSSLPGVGSVFAFNIDAPVLAREAAAEPAVVEESAGSGRFRVLIVDDNPVNRQVLGLILDAAAIEHAEAEDGQVGLDMVTTGGFDAVLMDLQMPVMDGFEAMRRIRAWEGEARRGRMPIYVVSANCLQEHVDAGVAAGADGHLNKPVSVPQLLAALTPHAEAAQAGARAA